MNDELASVLPTIIDSTRGRSYIVQGSAESQTSNSRRGSTNNYNMTDSRRNSNYNITDSRRGSRATESRRNSNTLQDFMKEIRRSVEYDDDDDIDASENDDNHENNKIDVESCENHDDEDNDIEDEANNIKKSGCGGGKTLFLKQIKKMLYKSCSIGLKAGVLLLGHILLSILKVLAFI